MQWVKTIFVLTLVAVWSMASNHCRLEFISALSFVACSDEGECTGEQDKDCETDACAKVENQLYKSENVRTALPAAVLLAACFVLSPLAEEAVDSRGDKSPDATPRVLSRGWQFSFRAALSPRAPSSLT